MRVIEVNSIPEDMFIKSKQIKDLFIMTIKGLDFGNRVILTSKLTELRKDITRKELAKEYRWLNNKKIVLCGCQRNKDYMVSKTDEHDCCAVFIPGGSILRMADGTDIKLERDNGCYLIKDDRFEDYFIVTRKEFKLAYIYNEDPVGVADRIKKIGNPSLDNHRKCKVTIKKDTVLSGNKEESTAEKPKAPIKYKAVARFVHGRDTVAFRLVKSTGETIDVKADTAAKLAYRDLIVNLTYSSGSSNRSHFRGKGILLTDLPVIRV